MKKKLLSSLFVFGVILVSLFLLVGCQLEAKVATAAENAGSVDANTARWISLGERYREDTVNGDRVATANIARWNAMGEHYQAIALEDIELATKAYIARWVALGERYREDTVNSDRVVAANNARWNALGDHYQMIALEDTELAAEANIARWVALGERYSTGETVAVQPADG